MNVRALSVGVAIAGFGLGALLITEGGHAEPRLRPPRDPELESLRVERPDGWWAREGFVELVTPIEPPTSRSARTRVQVFVRIPAGATIALDPLRLPPGSVADRVESVLVRGRWRVGDVRGARVSHHGSRRLRLMRPEHPEPDAPLVGFEWPEQRPDLGDAVHDAFGVLLREGGGSRARGGDRARLASLLRSRGDCVGCHQRERPARRRGAGPLRATDGLGFFTPLAVLTDRAPLERYRPRETNHERAHVTLDCDGAPPSEEEDGRGGVRLTCPEGASPIASLDLARALDDDEPRAEGVCASRRYLWAHFDEVGRERFAHAMRACESHQNREVRDEP